MRSVRLIAVWLLYWIVIGACVVAGPNAGSFSPLAAPVLANLQFMIGVGVLLTVLVLISLRR